MNPIQEASMGQSLGGGEGLGLLPLFLDLSLVLFWIGFTERLPLRRALQTHRSRPEHTGVC